MNLFCVNVASGHKLRLIISESVDKKSFFPFSMVKGNFKIFQNKIIKKNVVFFVVFKNKNKTTKSFFKKKGNKESQFKTKKTLTMPKTMYYHMLSHKDGHEYYFEQKDGMRAHRIDKTSYEKYTRNHDDHHDDGSVGPKHWAVGTQGNDGTVKYVYLKRKPGDSNTYEITSDSFHGNFDSDPTALERIGEVLSKHRAVLEQHTGKSTELPINAIYNLRGTSARTGSIMSLPTITTDEIKTSAAFGRPYSTLLLTDLNYLILHTNTSSRRKCYERLQTEQSSSRYLNTDSFKACIGDKCNYALFIIPYVQASYRLLESLLTETKTKSFFPPLFDHWPCSDTKMSYWLFDVKDLIQLTDTELNVDSDKKTKFKKEADKVLSNARFEHIHFDKKADEFFEANEFLQRKDGTLVHFNLIKISQFETSKSLRFAGKTDGELNLPSITGDATTAEKLDEDAMKRSFV
jgi:hypothetical protein